MTEMEQFELGGDEFIELYKVIKAMSWVTSGAEAKLLIDEGVVFVNEEKEMRRRKKLIKGDKVVYGDDKVEIV